MADTEACCDAVHGVAKSQTQLNDWTTGGLLAVGNQGCLQQPPRAFISVACHQVILWDKTALGH